MMKAVAERFPAMMKRVGERFPASFPARVSAPANTTVILLPTPHTTYINYSTYTRAVSKSPPFICLPCDYRKTNKASLKDLGSAKAVTKHCHTFPQLKHREKSGDHAKRFHHKKYDCESCGNCFISSKMKRDHADYCVQRWFIGTDNDH